MIILAFDTSTSSGSAALMSGGEVLAEMAVEDAVTHADWLMGAVDGLFKASRLRINDVGLIALSIGPGSFTGLRIGVTTAKALAWALDINIMGVPTLPALSMNVRHEGRIICPMLDARKGMVYTGLYSFEGDRIKTVMKESELSPAGLVREIEGRNIAPRDIVFLGGGMAPYGEAVKAAFQDARVAPQSLWHIRASNIAQIAHERHISGEKGLAPPDIIPLYLRKSEAEIKSNRAG